MGSSLFNLGKAFHDQLTGKLIVVAFVLLFFVIVFVISLHLYAKWYLYRNPQPPAAPPSVVVRRRRSRLDFPPGYYLQSSAPLPTGLDPTVLKSIPVLSSGAEKGTECAVCLSEIARGEKFRMLPNCRHWFHVDCIDTWFQSHATCPVCRNPLSSDTKQTEPNLDSVLQAVRAESNAATAAGVLFPTNVLFWGNQAQVLTRTLSSGDLDNAVVMGATSPSSSSGMVAIDMPEDEEQGTVTTRLRTLTRLLSRDTRVSPCSPSGDASQP